MTIVEDNKLYDFVTRNRVVCKCGHSIIIVNKDFIICNWCGHKVYSKQGKKNLFKKMIKEMRKNGTDTN